MKTTLVIMAAGIGSRFGGGIKQLAPVGLNGEIIMDYSIHDAIEAGFNKIVFIIRKDIKDAFKEAIGDHVSKYMEVAYAYQDLDDLPEEYLNLLSVGEPREKVVCDYVGAMTDRFAIAVYEDIYIPKSWQR